ncbi:MAG: sulfatase-like hydrolase/transferase [Bacteroidota bacterium]
MNSNYYTPTFFRPIVALILLCLLSSLGAQDQPNILLIIADDLGVDALNGYQESQLLPTTPHLDELRAQGITFTNAWATPVCTPTRATTMSGKYGVKTGVLNVPGNLDLEHNSIFLELEEQTNNAYADAVIGKWHISQPADVDHPAQHSVDHYEGVMTGAVPDYYAWQKTVDGETALVKEYVTSHFTNSAIDWINNQTQPWFLWLAHVAPHTPFHIPPDSMYTIAQTNTEEQQFMAMIEALDFSIGQLLANIPETELENTLIIFMGDNGTARQVIQNYPMAHNKGSVYQGGIHVPFIVAGAGVSRQGVEEDALVQVTDLYATILDVVGAELPGGIYNSKSFAHLLDGSEGTERPYSYSETESEDGPIFTIRNERWKLITFEDGTEEFYDLQMDELELTDLIPGGLNNMQQARREELRAEAQDIRTGWSCQDLIQNGDEEDIDCGGSLCAPCVTSTDELSEHFKISVYPNPTTDQIIIDSPEEAITEMRLYNAIGQLVYERTGLQELRPSLSLQHYNSSIMLVEIETASHRLVERIVLSSE